jgi:PAS domain S-box-containing protein
VPVLVLLLVSYSRSTMSWLPPQAPFAFLVPATFVAAWVGGLRVGVPFALVCALMGMSGLGSPPFGSAQTVLPPLALFLANEGIVLGLCSGLHRVLQRSRAARDEAARHFEIMANNAPVLIWCTDADGGCVFVNRNWIRFTGRASAPHRRRPGQLHPADAARYHAVASEAMSAHKPFRIEYRLRRADDSYRWLNEHAVPRFNQAGHFEGYIGSCSDVTDSRSEREELAFVARLQTTLTESLDLDKCADALAGAFVPRLADWCSIQLVNDAGELEQVRTFRIHGGGGLTITPSDFAATGRTGLESRIVEHGEVVFIEHAEEPLLRALAFDEAHFKQMQSQGGAAYLGVPLRARGQIIGVLALATLTPDRSLRTAERRLVQKIAGIAGFALDNARLYRSARRALASEEHALREVEQMERRFRFLWEANLFGMGTVAPSGRILTANATLCQLLDYSPEMIATGAASINERTAPGWHAADLHSGAELLRTGRCAPYEKEYIRPDGTKVQVMVCGMVLPQTDECLTFVLDLTPQKHAERALVRQGALLETIIEAMPAMVGYLGRDGRFLLHNEKCRQWLGAPKSALDGQNIRDLLGASSYERMAPYLQAAFRGRNMRHECTLSSDDRERHLIASYHPDRDPEGNVCGVVLHAYDITERKEIEQALAEALRRYRFLADAMPQMVWTASPDGHLDYVNHRWLETTGMTEAASLAIDGWLEAVHFEDREATRARWRQAVANSAPFEHECRLRCGKAVTWRWHLVRALPRRDDLSRIVQWVGSATNIDELRLAYAELSQARERLKSHSEELETRVRARTATLREINAELEAFTYSVSHDLRTPLQFVRGFAEAIHTDPRASLSPENRDYLQRIIRSASRMDTIIQDLLAYSRLTRSDMQLVELPLEDVVSDVLANHQAAIRQSGATVVVERPLPHVCADSTGLFQAISNLVANALKFHRPDRPPSIRLRTERTDHGIRLWVEDEGIGIDPRHHEQIFKLFERLHSQTEYPGTGIGLSLVRKAVHRMGGACGVESSPGSGSRFWIDFPDVCPLAGPTEPARHTDANRTVGVRPQVHQAFTEGD